MMAVEGDNNFVRYIYRGEVEEVIPRHVTHITVREDVRVVRRYVFSEHFYIVEVVCHDKVEKIEEYAFWGCDCLRRVIMPGVKIVEEGAFSWCDLTDVECGKLEIIEREAFQNCDSLRSINLPSAEIVEELTFDKCKALTDVKFGNKLERIDGGAFRNCSLERITIPLKDGIFTDDNIFQACQDLSHVDLVESALLHEIISALQLEEWRDDMNEEIDSINQILPDTNAGDGDIDGNVGGKARAIRRWIRSVLFKIAHYKGEHQSLLDEAATALYHALPCDIVMKNILPLLQLPSYLLLAHLKGGITKMTIENHSEEEE